jgi:uncharacterized protein (TIGR03435 family)
MNRDLSLETCVLSTRKMLLSAVGIALLVLSFIPGLVVQVHALTTAENQAKDIAGTWHGTLHAGGDLRVVIKISKADDGTYKVLCYSIDQSADPIPVAKIVFQETAVKMLIPFVGGTYEGRLSEDGRMIAGNVSQGPNTIPLDLTRATADTEWTIQSLPPTLPAMDPNATPRFEVATIKPSKPDQGGGHEFQHEFQGHRLRFTNITLNQLITFSYNVHTKQAIGTPPWAGTDKFDIEVKPEGEDMPSGKQWKSMLQKLMADRFKLEFHREMKELPIYALSVGKVGPKLTKGDPNGVPSLHFGVLGTLHVTNATMADFVFFMQWTVLDRPVVDQTGLDGRFDFDLIWKPDDSQFAGLEAKIPPPADAPPLYTAIQEQIGLKLDNATMRMQVLVIDHVEKPSGKEIERACAVDIHQRPRTLKARIR